MQAMQQFISQLYRAGVDRPAEDFQRWGLQQLSELVPHDAAIWGMGNAQLGEFHNVKVFGVPMAFANTLQEWGPKNPLFPLLAKHPGKPLDMADEYPDASFYRSELYKKCFKRFGIERILSSGHSDERCGLYTLLSIYRTDRKQPFSNVDKKRFETASYHLIAAYSHAYFLHLARPVSEHSERPAAVVDREGYLHEVEPEFTDLLSRHYPSWRGMRLPLDFVPGPEPVRVDRLWIQAEALADLFVVRIWEETPLDRLTPRERQVVLAVCRGLSHKEVGRELGLAPTTVSSHLYRAYAKLGVESRSALARLVHGEGGVVPV
jgi:DNA-binding CsgD family transcriptional regulator